jgi:hypothetical protein
MYSVETGAAIKTSTIAAAVIGGAPPDQEALPSAQ